MLEHIRGNISETCEVRGKVTMEGLYEITNTFSNGTIPDSLWLPLPQDWGFATDGRTTCNLNTVPCTVVHRAVIIIVSLTALIEQLCLEVAMAH